MELRLASSVAELLVSACELVDHAGRGWDVGPDAQQAVIGAGEIVRREIAGGHCLPQLPERTRDHQPLAGCVLTSDGWQVIAVIPRRSMCPMPTHSHGSRLGPRR